MALEKFVVYGVGSGYLLSSDGTLVPLMEMQDMSIEVNTTKEDVYGGDGLFPIFSFIKDKTASFTFTNATFSLELLQVSQGASIVAGGELLKDEVVVPATGSANLSVTANVVVDSVVAVDLSLGKALKRVTGTPQANEFAVTSGGVMTFNTAQNGKNIQVSYSYTEATAMTANILTTSVPGFVELRHKSSPIEQTDGSKYEIHTRIFKARSDGKINIDYKRGQAFAPKLTFNSIDPQRADKKFVSFTIKKL